ncbi:hypothetical protein OFC58_27535, partial [Escherichia coli]|nr:hypothetical protein [Escherichia coli]
MSFITLDGQSLVSLSRENTPESSSSLNNKVVSVPLLQQHILAMNSKLDVHRESLAGIFKINDNIWGLSLAPVRNSEGDRPSNGWMLWGRNLSERFPGDFKAMMSASNTL